MIEGKKVKITFHWEMSFESKSKVPDTEFRILNSSKVNTRQKFLYRE